MSSFGSSVINKGSRKIAPKAPVRRRTTASAQTAPKPPQDARTDTTSGAAAPSPLEQTHQSQSAGLPTHISSHVQLASQDQPDVIHDAERSETTPHLSLSPAQARQDDSTSAHASLFGDQSLLATGSGGHSQRLSPALTSERTGATDDEQPAKRQRIESLHALPATSRSPTGPLPATIVSRDESLPLEHDRVTLLHVQGIAESSPAVREETAGVQDQVVQDARAKAQTPRQSRSGGGKGSARKQVRIMQAVESSRRRQLRPRMGPASAASTQHSTLDHNSTPGLPALGGQAGGRTLRAELLALTHAGDQVDDADVEAAETSDLLSRESIPGMVIIENGVTRQSRPRKIRSDKGRKRKSQIATTGDVRTGADTQEDESAEESAAARRPRRKRAATPEDSENVMIDASTVLMTELTKDGRHGKLSQREKEMRRIDWGEVSARRELAMWKDPKARYNGSERGNDGDNPGTEGGAENASGRGQNDLDSPAASGGGEMITYIMRNGVITLNTDSTRADRRKRQEEQDKAMEVVEEDDLERRLTSHSWRFMNARTEEDRIPAKRRGKRWSAEDTDTFYDALQMFGTDFMIISKMFQGRTRRHIKLKFVAEEKADPARVKEALIGGQVPMNLDHYIEQAGLNADDLKDPEVINEELRVEHEQRKQDIEEAKVKAAEEERQKKEAAELGKEQKKKRERRKKGQTAVGGEEVEVVEEGLD